MTEKQRTNLFIDPELWRALRVRALEEGMSATALLNRVIAAYLDAAPAGAAAKRRQGAKGR
jgi:hypothetical protein